MTGFAAILDAMRAGQAPRPDQMVAIVQGLTDGRMSDAQAGAFAMAVCCNGLPDEAAATLTAAMAASGARLPRRSDRPRLDKHSTGGLGDSTSLVLAPLLAAFDIDVPMISGRSLGHTGGTLDKLESLPGLSVELSPSRMAEIVDQCGAVIAAASADIAPADRRLYAVRDATGTVQSPALITASILSKKLAAQLDGLIFDVKTGSGAILTEPTAAQALAERLVAGATAHGLKASALITAMDQPLLPCLGNGLEMAACLRVLRGERVSTRFESVVLALAARLTGLAGLPVTKAALLNALHSGQAYERFARMARAMGAAQDPEPGQIPAAPVQMAVRAAQSGVLSALDGRALGWAVHRLGPAGDPRIGISQMARLGTKIMQNDPLCLLHAVDEDQAAQTAQALSQCFTIAPDAAPLPLIISAVPGA